MIYRNQTLDAGGGVMAKGDCHVTLTNNTIVYNTASFNGGISTHGEGGAAIISGENNIIFFNTAYQHKQYGAVYGGGDITLSYTCIGQEIDGEGNIFVDPLFVNSDLNNFSLQSGSPCIDAGDPSSPYDPDNTIADMGAIYHSSLSIDNNSNGIKRDYLKIYPNPFNPTTKIELNIKHSSGIALNIFNLVGQKIKTFNIDDSGRNIVIWNGKDDFGKKVASGIYFVNLKSENKSFTKKILLLK